VDILVLERAVCCVWGGKNRYLHAKSGNFNYVIDVITVLNSFFVTVTIIIIIIGVTPFIGFQSCSANGAVIV
jgi:hypothetical protein